jgi:1-acyl-sn-glycerol-3-phosphate acyltransferase
MTMKDWELRPSRDLMLTPLARFRSISREDGFFVSVFRIFWWLLVRGYLKGYHRLEVVGREKIPKGGSCILVANHGSHLDAVVLASAISLKLRDCTFPIAAGEVFFDRPGLAAFSAMAINALPIWRLHPGPHALKDMRDRLTGESCFFILFPEGKRTRTGEMNRFKSGLGKLVAGTDVAVVPCFLEGTAEALPPGAYLPRWHKIKLVVGDPKTYSETSNDLDGWKQIAHETEHALHQMAGAE